MKWREDEGRPGTVVEDVDNNYCVVCENVAPECKDLLLAAPQLYEALEWVEWGGFAGGTHYCICCNQRRGQDHADDCAVGEALKEARRRG